MRRFIAEFKSFLAILPRGSWARACVIVLVCLVSLVIVLTVADSSALFYLYSFDRDPKRWSNVSVLYTRPKENTAGRALPQTALLASLVMRGNNENPAYALRHELSLADIKPSALHDCLLAAEDKRFYRHTGFDYLSVVKALYDHLISEERLRGGSTISNQLVRTVILADQSRSLWRKIPEIFLTAAAERHFSKDDLLLSYVNNVPVGHADGRALIGLSAASETLFGKREPKALTLSESCTLAGMLNRPNAYLKQAAVGDYGRIIRRRNVVLTNLGSSNPERYSSEAIERAKREQVRFFKNSKKTASDPRHFIAYAYQQLPRKKPGQRVYLTVDQNLQRVAENAVNHELAGFDHGPHGYYNRLSYRHALKQGRKVSEEEAKLQAALVALDPKTGEILAMVGGRNPAGEFNRAAQAKRAPGSIIKPFVYLYGINAGYLYGKQLGPDTVIDPARSPAAQRYTTGGAASATVQLARSDNGAAVAIAHEFGVSRVRDFIARITGANPEASEGLALGAGKGMELSPLEVALAYTVFANDGVKAAPRAVGVVYENGRELNVFGEKLARLIKPGPALTVAGMLQAVIGDGPEGQHGTARMARRLAGLDSGVMLAGKTGTGDHDLWFVGFTPRIVVVVWVGFDHNFPPFEMEKGFTGSGLALQIWATFMRGVKKYRPDLLTGSFEKPAGVKKLTMSRSAGASGQT